ncbi:uncharacterized protein LOC132264552 [Phlebotomus argentipes]|uniref:uncharacterized protein LOC132264552 n=1 Tax=Phlebotomus argentipes TaxID=94469 RepID=UPI00289365BE|nr:uncharacterized protein LOC132264552 [Phlebotomus argentipes]
MRRLPKRDKMYDRVHRGVVWACIGLTLYATTMLGTRVFNYFTVVKPARKQQELELVKENAQPTAALLDKIPELKG